ncbi:MULTISPECIES: site-specific tyrosine recombinase XerD [Porphyromonadaceae]|uniref:Tyrosine recombinase XerC n=1 Tax=Sanguibacteroides justesenii TaxID=1547597 RepID=A0A0C3NKK1_9PORP|nr:MULTISPECIES: site-specific tyrosine recombinase XerD [Porphyromonadaceae]KIO46747.1 integrase [Sanguibacteroides justesenii]MCR9013001.1 site-specific tyrosine recombinase XerD [Gabonibacter chumensis]PXZ43733.1 site-specific tyrosine recombinase XerD [Sanguibacteroides justesenii]
MTWNEAIDNFKTYLTLEKSLSSNSVEAYLNDIKKLAAFSLQSEPQLQPEEITYAILNNHLSRLKDSGITARSQARSISSIKSFFKFMVYDEVITVNPAASLDTPKIGKALPSVLSVEEIEAMIDAVNLKKPEGQRNKAIIETLYSCGLRVSELVNLKLSNINFRVGYIKIEGKGNKERLVPLNNKAKDEIRIYTKTHRAAIPKAKGYEDVLFLNKKGKALSRVMVFNIIKELALKAGINKTVSPHTLRHSFASHLVNGGADIRAVQDMLGHESILTTEIYTHLDNTFLRDTIINFHPRAKNSRK